MFDLSFNWTSQLINDISIDLQKLLGYFNGIAISESSGIPFAAALISINLVLYLKDWKKSSVAAIVLLKLASSSINYLSY